MSEELLKKFNELDAKLRVYMPERGLYGAIQAITAIVVGFKVPIGLVHELVDLVLETHLEANVARKEERSVGN